MKSSWMRVAVAVLLSGVLAAPLSAQTPSAFEIIGTGTVETNCIHTLVSGCTATSTGQMTGSPMLPGQFILRLDTGSPSSLNGYPHSPNQGICLPASYRGALTETGGDSIYFNHAGSVCEEEGPSSSYVYHGTFRVTSGTGRFAAATGGGIVVGTFTREGTFTRGSGVAFVYIRGAISY